MYCLEIQTKTDVIRKFWLSKAEVKKTLLERDSEDIVYVFELIGNPDEKFNLTE